MKTKKIICLILSILLCLSLASCSGLDARVSETFTISEYDDAAVDEEIVHPKLEISDESGNVLCIIPIYSGDGSQTIAGYVESARVANGNALNKDDFEYIGQVVVLNKNENNESVISYGEDNKIVLIEALFDEENNLIAIKDSIDADGDGDVEEYFQIHSELDAQGNMFIKLDIDEQGELINVLVETQEDGKTAVVSRDGTKTTVSSPREESGSSGDSSSPSQDENRITLSKNSTASTGAESGVTISSGLVTITEGKDYIINSDTKEWHGRIVVAIPNTESCELRFENVNISYNKGNILQIQDSSIETNRDFLETEFEATDSMDDAIKDISESEKAPNVSLSFPTGTVSTFHSTANSYTGVIYNESKLTIKGNGRLNIESRTNADNCLCSTKSVTIKNVTLDMSTAGNTLAKKLAAGTGSAKGIFSYGKVTVESGRVDIKTNGDAIRADDFYCKGGVVNLTSSACDAIDTDDRILISGGSITAVALEKSAYKVRRVNNKLNGIVDTKLTVRLDENKQVRDYFKITSGTVVGESKKMTEVTIADQANILARIKKSSSNVTGDGAISSDDSQRRQIISIEETDGSFVRSSQNKCTKFLYSSYELDEELEYTAYGDFTTTPANVDWSTKIGKAKIKCTT